MKALEVRNLTYKYDDGTVALKDLDLTIEQGAKVAIVGPNGAGKSTLLNLVAGFRMPFTGSVLIQGRQLSEANADELRRDVGLVFQDPEDQIFMPTVEEDVAFGPRNLGLDDVDGRVKAALRSSGIEVLAKRRPHKLSHGMKKRVAIAGILAMEPTILLLDEPTSGLDPKARSDLVRILKQMDKTMLIATHDLDAAAEIVDRAVILNVSVVMDGSMRDIAMAKQTLQDAGLELPAVTRLFDAIDRMGYPIGSLPVSLDQAVAELTKVIDRESKRGPRKASSARKPRPTDSRADGD